MARRKKVLIGILCLLVLGALFVGIEILISYKCLMVKEYAIESERIEESVKLVLISDLHDSEFGEGNQRLVEKIRDQKPDVLLLDGDILNEDSADSHVAVELVEQLRKIAPVYYSLGNHEEEYLNRKTSDLMAELKSAGAVVLDQEFSDIEVKGNSLRIGGLYDYAFAVDGKGELDVNAMDEKLCKFLKDFQSTDAFSVMMAHRPDSFIWGDAANYWKIDLVVSGHNHGGQIIIPGKGGLYGGDQGWFPKYVDGMHHFEAVKNMIITRGLGSSSEKLPRFNNIPEIVVIDLKKK